MIRAAVVSSWRVPTMRPTGFFSVSPGVTLDQRHDGDAGLEAGQAQGELGEDEQGDDRRMPSRFAVLGRQQPGPVG